MRPEEAARSSVTDALLALTERPYDEYNTILPQIKFRLETFDDHSRDLVFEEVLEEELPLTTVRRAYRTAIKIAMGEKNVFREFVPPKPKSKKKKVDNGPKGN
jgi:hypothetical protein